MSTDSRGTSSLGPGVMGHLGTLLKSQDVAAKITAARRLRHAKARSVVDALIKTLESSGDVALRCAVADTLGTLEDGRAIPHLVPLLKGVETTHDAAAALNALGWHPSDGEEQAWLALGCSNLQKVASLGPSGLPALECALQSAPLRMDAVTLLRQLRASSAAAALRGVLADALLERGRQVPVRIAEADAARPFIRLCVETLADFRDVHAIDLILKLPLSACDPDGTLLECCLTAVGKIAPNWSDADAVRSHLPSLGDILSSEPFGPRSTCAAALLAAIPAAGSLLEFIRGLEHSDHRVRLTCANHLQERGWQPLNPSEKAAFLVSLGRYAEAAIEAGELSIDPLARASRSSDVSVVVAAVEALGRVGTAAAGAPLLAKLGDPDERTRHAAEAALTRLTEPLRTGDLLTVVLACDGRGAYAFGALERQRDLSAIETLLDILNDPYKYRVSMETLHRTWDVVLATAESHPDAVDAALSAKKRNKKQLFRLLRIDVARRLERHVEIETLQQELFEYVTDPPRQYLRVDHAFTFLRDRLLYLTGMLPDLKAPFLVRIRARIWRADPKHPLERLIRLAALARTLETTQDKYDKYTYHVSLEPGDDATRELCQWRGSVSTRLLEEVAVLADQSVTLNTCLVGTGGSTWFSFETRRQMAQRELERRRRSR